MMKPRQYKKLCKKAAEIMKFESCRKDDDGIWYFQWQNFDEWDCEDAWPRLVEFFCAAVNTEDDGKGDLIWKPEQNQQQARPLNVLSWAKLNF